MSRIICLGEKCWNIIETIVRKVIVSIYRLIHKDLSDEVYTAYIQFVKFCLIGVTNTAVSYFITVISLVFFQKMGMSARYDYLVAQFVGFVISVLWSFYWNNRLVFTEDNDRRVWWRALIKTYVSYSFTCVFLNSVLSWIWVTIFNISKIIAPLINVVLDVPINFLINKFWAFRADEG